MKTIEGDLSINNKKVALVAGRFNSFIVEHLISGAKEALLKSGTQESDIDLIYVPGAFEIPLALKKVPPQPLLPQDLTAVDFFSPIPQWVKLRMTIILYPLRTSVYV